MGRNRGADLPLPSDARVAIPLHVSWIVDRGRGEAILLDEREGRYWHLSGSLLEVVFALQDAHEGRPLMWLMSEVGSCEGVERAEWEEAILALRAASLLDIVEPRAFEGLMPAKRAESDGRHRPRRPTAVHAGTRSRLPASVAPDCERQPPFGLVLRYALLSLWYSALVRLCGWAPVRSVLARQRSIPEQTSAVGWATDPSLVGEEITAAMRCACVFPWIRRDCVRHALIVHHLFTSLGYAPRLRIGANVVGFEPHMWVEVEGCRIDSGDSDHSLAVFTRIHGS